MDGPDLEGLARVAYLEGQDDTYVTHLERAFEGHLQAEDPARAARCAFWIGLNLGPRGESARATGWWRRGERLLQEHDLDCVERGYLMIPGLLGCVGRGDSQGALAIARTAAAIAERFGDPDLHALVTMEEGHALVRQGREDDGFQLLDEVMVTLTTGELSPVVIGIVYCNTLLFCARMFDLQRAREWTAALSRWCDERPEMLAHTGVCLVHRAELMELRGAWDDALTEARRAEGRAGSGVLNHASAGQAVYRQGEVHRQRGAYDAAELAYREAAARGCEPQPGLALLRLAQGNLDAAGAAIRRVAAETTAPLERARLLPALVEILLAAGDVDAARAASSELAAVAKVRQSHMLAAMAAQAEGSVALAEGNPRGALPALRGSWQLWEELDVPYESARVRVLLALACRALGDEDTALLELGIAQRAFAELGAAPDVERVRSFATAVVATARGGLTGRELQVLRLLARGLTNKAIGEQLVISERTVDRHVSNIFSKAGVASRAAATAFAYENQLV